MVHIPPAEYLTELEAGSAAAAARGADAKEIKMILISPDLLNELPDFNVRVTDTPRFTKGIESLGRDIANNGFARDKPFTATVYKDVDGGDCYGIVDGYRRKAALNWVKENEPDKYPERVPVILKPAGTSLIDLLSTVGQDGESLTPYERALHCKRLFTAGLVKAEVAVRAHITENYVDQLMSLMGAPMKVQRAVATGKMSATEAIATLKAQGGTKGAKSIEKAVDNAEKEGRTRATRKDVEEASEASAAPVVTTTKRGLTKTDIEWSAKAGDVVALAAIQAFQGFDGGAWYAHDADVPGQVIVQRDIKVKLTVTEAPIPEQAAETADEPTEGETGAQAAEELSDL